MPSLSPEFVAPLVRGRFAVPYLWRETCASTQDLLRDSGLPEGALAVAEHQTHGRGRLGKMWEERPGESILMSILLRPPVGSPTAQLSLVTALATALAIEHVTGLTAELKWPNDVLLGGRKVAGILLEGDGDAVLCGVGINVSQTADTLPRATRLPATSVALAAGRPIDRALLLAVLVDRLEAEYDRWRHDGLRALLPAFAARHRLTGREVTAGRVTGTVAGVADDGALVLVTADGESARVVSDEVIDLEIERLAPASLDDA